ncbi:MAG TPA: YdcF family protein [Candidatus Paceibacterota bacterium]|nr:YdcF family protein [Candidatus Paceibacterota bacterium]
MEQIKTSFKRVLDFLTDQTPEEKLPKADAIFVFGHTDPRIANHAAHLYKLKKAKMIILTGKGRKNIPNFESEASYYASLMESDGIPRSSLILEDLSMNSLENVLFGIKTCHDNNFFPNSLIIVAVPPLLRRSRATFEKQFPNIKIYSSSPDIPLEEYLQHAKRILEEFDRFDEYSKKGDIASVKVPQGVQDAIQSIKLII